MAKASAPSATAAAAAELSAPPAVAPTPQPANTVQRPAVLPQPGGKIDSTEPLVRQFERQYRTDFDDGSEVFATRDIPAAGEIDAAMPEPDPGRSMSGTEEKLPGAKREPRKTMSQRISTERDDIAAHDAAQVGAPATETTPTSETPAAETPAVAAQAVLTREQRRKALADIEAESNRRQSEQSLHAERTRIAGIEAKLKSGSVTERLALAFPGMSRDELIEGLVSGTIAIPEAGAPVKPEDDRIAKLEREIADLKGTSPAKQDDLAITRLRNVAAHMAGTGVALPFSTKAGADADAMRLKVVKATWKMQGEKGQVDGARVCQVVEEHFEEQFRKLWGDDVADVVKGKKPTATLPAVETPAATGQRRAAVGRRGTHAAPSNKDPLPINKDARDRAIMREIDAMEGTVAWGPR